MDLDNLVCGVFRRSLIHGRKETKTAKAFFGYFGSPGKPPGTKAGAEADRCKQQRTSGGKARNPLSQ